MNPMAIHSSESVKMPMTYFGSVEWWAAACAFGRIVVDDCARFDKRYKRTHRMDIVDTHGIKQLTVPITRPSTSVRPYLRWDEVGISSHGQWWHVVDETLASAYGRTPFYEFYVDRLRQFFDASTPERFGTISRLDVAAARAVGSILGIDGDSIVSLSSLSSAVDDTLAPLPSITDIKPYYQVRADRFGFIAGLSILDLIFNLGPEAAVYLRETALNNRI